MGDEFFAVNMFSHFDGVHGCERVKVIGCGDYDTIDIFLLLEHLAEIGVTRRLWELFEDPGGMGSVDVAEGNNVFVFELGDVMAALAAQADAGQVEFLIGGDGPIQSQDAAGNDLKGGRAESRARQKATAGDGGN